MHTSNLEEFKGAIGKLAPKSLWFGTEIPKAKLENAINSYANGVIAERVIALHDATIFGKSDEGFIVTDSAFYCKKFNGKGHEIRFYNLQSVTVSKDLDKIYIIITTFDGNILPAFSFDRVQGESLSISFQDFFNQIIRLREEGELNSEDRYVIIQDMPESFRIAYTNVAVCLIRRDVIDASELTELQLLMIRLELTAAARNRVWSFLSTCSEDKLSILRDLESLTPRGAWSVISLSLIKDLMGISRKRNLPNKIDPFVQDIARLLRVSDEKIQLIQQSWAFEDAVLSSKAGVSELKIMASDLAAKAGALGVPLTAIYLSGSVIGFSAAGITSGLAALGFGGVLGLSSMVTGIGVVIIMGVFVYKTIRSFTGDEVELAMLRERLMQEVIRQLQRSINALIEDIIELTNEVVEVAKQNEINDSRIRELAQLIKIRNQAIVNLTGRQEPPIVREE